jgi:hypothetical protein
MAAAVASRSEVTAATRESSEIGTYAGAGVHDNQDETRIAAPEMLAGADLLPH